MDMRGDRGGEVGFFARAWDSCALASYYVDVHRAHDKMPSALKRVLGGGGPGGQGEVSMEEYHTSIHAWLRRLEEPDNVKTLQ